MVGPSVPRSAWEAQPPRAKRPKRPVRSQTSFSTPSRYGPLAGSLRNEELMSRQPGGIAGYLASLCGTDSYVNITAKTDCYVGFLPAQALQRILERRPIVLLTLAKRLQQLLSPLVLHIDAALDWMQLSAGQVLYEKGDRSSDFYIVISRYSQLRCHDPPLIIKSRWSTTIAGHQEQQGRSLARVRPE